MNIFEQIEALTEKVASIENTLMVKKDDKPEIKYISNLNQIIFNLRLELHFLYEQLNVLGFSPKIRDIEKQECMGYQHKCKCDICPHKKSCQIYSKYRKYEKKLLSSPNNYDQYHRIKNKERIEKIKEYINLYCNGDKNTINNNAFFQKNTFSTYIEQVMAINT